MILLLHGKGFLNLSINSNPFSRSKENMTELFEKKCVPCEGNIPAFDYSEIHKYLKKVNGWNVKTNEKKNYFIEKEFIFKNFVESQKFVNLVGEISEKEGHHPDIAFGWGYAKIKILTHAVKGLSENDFILASKIDAKTNV